MVEKRGITEKLESAGVMLAEIEKLINIEKSKKEKINLDLLHTLMRLESLAFENKKTIRTDLQDYRDQVVNLHLKRFFPRIVFKRDDLQMGLYCVDKKGSFKQIFYWNFSLPFFKNILRLVVFAR